MIHKLGLLTLHEFHPHDVIMSSFLVALTS